MFPDIKDAYESFISPMTWTDKEFQIYPASATAKYFDIQKIKANINSSGLFRTLSVMNDGTFFAKMVKDFHR